MLNIPPWMFALETEIRLAEVTVGWSWSTDDQDVGYIPLLFPKVTGSWSHVFENTNFKRALISRPSFWEAIWVLCSDWLSHSTLGDDWLYFHMWRMQSWLYVSLFTCENIAHIEFYVQGLLRFSLYMMMMMMMMMMISAGHRHFCLYGFLQHDWSRQNQNKEIWPRGTGSTKTLCTEMWTAAILQRSNITVKNTGKCNEKQHLFLDLFVRDHLCSTFQYRLT